MMVQERDGHVRQVRQRPSVRRVAQLLAGLLPRPVARDANRQWLASDPLAMQGMKLCPELEGNSRGEGKIE
jgi:hypothetical protein